MTKKDKDEAARQLSESKRDLERLEQEIAPFVKKRPQRRPTTAGQWQDSRVVSRPAGVRRQSASS